MISWLKGNPIDSWTNNSKEGLIVACGDIGYEIQVLPRHQTYFKRLKEIILWIHQVYRDDGILMFGFKERSERDLFRKIIEVNGIGPQIAISLLEEYKYQDLIAVIKNKSISQLTKVTGVGRRTAERITIELRDKLSGLNNEENNLMQSEINPIEKPITNDHLQSQVSYILKNLDYEDSEITAAIQAIDKEIVAQEPSFNNELSTAPDKLMDDYLKKTLIWLSQEVSSKGS